MSSLPPPPPPPPPPGDGAYGGPPPPPPPPPPAGAGAALPGGLVPAEWVQRLLALLIDAATIGAGYVVILIVTLILSAVSDSLATFVAIVLYVVVVAWAIYNLWIKQGQTGYTLGKGIIGIRLVDATTGQPVGIGLAIARQFVHILDSIPCYIGWLWPLWDARRETFADKILKQAVVTAPKVDPRSFIPEQLHK